MTKVRLILLAGLLAVCAMQLAMLSGCRSAHTTSAILYIEEQRYDKAVRVLHEGLDYSPDEPSAFYWLGEAHSKVAEVAVQDNDYPEAKKNYELAYGYYVRAKDLDPEEFTDKSDLATYHNYRLRSQDAKSYFDEKEYEQAEGYYRLAYASLPDSTGAIKNLARMKIIMAREKEDDPALFREALGLLDQVLETRPDAFELLANKAEVLVALERPDEASRIYDDLLKEHGDDAALVIDIASLDWEQGNLERAADLYLHVVDIYENDDDPSNDDSDVNQLLVLAATLLAKDEIRRYDDALNYFDRALQLELVPTQGTQFEYLRTYYNYGDWLTRQAGEEVDSLRKAELEAQAQAQYTRGIEVGNALVDSYPGAKYGFYYLFLCHSALGDDAAAQLNFQKFDELQSMGG